MPPGEWHPSMPLTVVQRAGVTSGGIANPAAAPSDQVSRRGTPSSATLKPATASCGPTSKPGTSSAGLTLNPGAKARERTGLYMGGRSGLRAGARRVMTLSNRCAWPAVRTGETSAAGPALQVASGSRRAPQRVDLRARDTIPSHLLEEARPQVAAARPPLAEAVGFPVVPPQRRPRPAPVALVRLHVRKPAECRMRMRLVRQQEGPLVAIPAVVAIEQPRQAEPMDDAPEIGARVLDLGLAHRDRPGAPVAASRGAARREGPPRAADQVRGRSPGIAKGEGVGQRLLPGLGAMFPLRKLSVNF